MTTLYEQAGGKDAIEAILRTFYDEVFDDMMIGFHFGNADKERLIRVETQMTCIALGATDMKYEGKTIIRPRKHPILGGQFERRLQILREAMEKHELPQHVRDAWIEHNQKLELKSPQILVRVRSHQSRSTSENVRRVRNERYCFT